MRSFAAEANELKLHQKSMKESIRIRERGREKAIKTLTLGFSGRERKREFSFYLCFLSLWYVHVGHACMHAYRNFWMHMCEIDIGSNRKKNGHVLRAPTDKRSLMLRSGDPL